MYACMYVTTFSEKEFMGLKESKEEDVGKFRLRIGKG